MSDESESLQITFEVPPDIEISEEELAGLLDKFRSWLIDSKPERKGLQTKVTQVHVMAKSKVPPSKK